MTLNFVLYLYPVVLYKLVTIFTMQDFRQTLIVAYLINAFPWRSSTVFTSTSWNMSLYSFKWNYYYL